MLVHFPKMGQTRNKLNIPFRNLVINEEAQPSLDQVKQKYTQKEQRWRCWVRQLS